ncbi:S8 family serine peptidase, partial [Halovivax sp.]|uniref:S8 family serine peptidase n=1 Tax=Halovivax sp. TaxID=1935978 RepID=UPI0025BB3D60
MKFNRRCILISVVLLATLLAGVSLGGVAIADVSIAADEESIPEHSEEIDEPLQDAEGETELILRLDPVNDAHLAGDREATVETLQSHADRTQQPVLDRLEHMGGVAVEDRWWIVNGILITADLDRVDLEELRSIENVELVHEHYTFDAPEPVQTEPVAETTDGTRTDDVEATYGLEQIKALDTWDEIGVTGADVRVVVADTGVDANHPDIELPEEDGWNDLADGEDEPADEHGHGTHVGGTIAGGDASGTAIGVAPEAEQAHARVCGADGLCEGQAIYDSFEWAVETDSDLISLSLGSASPHGQYTELIHNTMNAGTLVVASIGNDGEGTAGSPGADYDSIASGASNETGGIASFSGGMLIEEGDFDGEWMDHWPEGEFVTPDIAAPGADVYSAHPTDGGTMCGDVDYCEVSGTSMSAPHKSGAAALIIGAAGGELDPWDVKELMLDTAWKPDDWDPDDAQYYDEEGGIDSRYGAGIIDVYAATAQVAVDSGVEGVVTDADGEPIDGAAVTVEDGASTETDADGGYDLIQAPGTYDVTADGFGFAAQTETVTIDDDEHVVERDFALEAALAIELVDGQDETIEGGDGVTAEFDAANLEELVVEIGGSYDESDATLFVDGTEAQFGEPVDFDGDEDAVEVVVETTTNTEGEFSLEHSFEGLGDEETITTGPTTVFEELQPVAVVDDGDTFGDDVAEMLSASLPENYDLFVADSDEAAEEFDVIVVQHLDADDAADFVDATADGDTGVVYLDQWGNWSNGVPVYSDVTDDPGATSEDYNDSEPVIYKFVDDHEIFDGVGEAGDSIDVHFDTYGDHTWFADTSFDVYAEIGDQEGIAGDAFAVDEESATVLASGLGYTSFVTDDDYTDDAHAILANSVEFLASEVVDHPTISGSVEIVDNPAPEGAIVEAYVDDELRGTTAVETPGEFDELVVDGEAAVDDGATIAFAVGGLPVDQEATWSEGSHEQLDLTASGNATVELEAGDDRFGEPIEDATIA